MRVAVVLLLLLLFLVVVVMMMGLMVMMMSMVRMSLLLMLLVGWFWCNTNGFNIYMVTLFQTGTSFTLSFGIVKIFL